MSYIPLTRRIVIRQSDTPSDVPLTTEINVGEIALNAADGVLYVKDNGNNITLISALENDPVIPGTGGMVVPTGTTAQRPASPTNGTLRYNSTTNKFEGYQNNTWTDIVGGGVPGGSNAQIQFNDGSVFGGDVDFTWNKTSNELAINAGRMVIGSSTGSSNVRLRLFGDVTYNTPISVESFGAQSLILLQRANGTSGTPTAVVNNEVISSLSGSGYDGTTYQQTADMLFQVLGTVSGGNVPTGIVFRTSPSNTASKLERLRIAPSGAIGLSGANYGTAGQVLTSQGSGSPPVWQNVTGTPAGSNTQIQFNNAGAFGADADFTWDSTNNILRLGGAAANSSIIGARNATLTIAGEAASGVSGSGGHVAINGGAGDLSGTSGGNVSITAGYFAQISGSPGNVTITGGGASSANGGPVTISGGSVLSSTSTGGTVTIRGGASASVFGATLTLTGCSSSPAASSLQGTTALAGTGGTLILQGGTGSDGGTGQNGGPGGSLLLRGGLGGPASIYSPGAGGPIVFATAATTSFVECFRILNNGAWSLGSSGSNTGTSGQVLVSQGSSLPPTWQTISGGGGTPGGSNTQIQFNNAGAFGGDADFTWDSTNNILGINGVISLTGTGAVGSPNINMNKGTMNWIRFNDQGVGGPSLLTNAGTGAGRSLGSKIVLFPTSVAGRTDYAIGIESGHVWFSTTGESGTGFKFYVGTVERFRINDVGAIGLSGANFGTAGQVLTSQGSGSPPTWQTPSVTNIPYDLATSIQGIPPNGLIVFTYVAPRTFTITANFVGSQAKAGTAATASAVFTIRKNGASIGTVTFAASATTGTFSGAAASFVAGDVLTILAPSPADATLADIGITLAGTV